MVPKLFKWEEKNNLSSGQLRGTVKVLISPGESIEHLASSQGMGERAIKLEELRQNCLAIAQEIRGRFGSGRVNVERD